VAGLVLPAVDRHVALPNALAISGQQDTARSVLTAIVTLCVSVAGVSFSVLAVALVLASQQLSPRVLRSFQRQALNQAVLGLLLGTATYALVVLSSISKHHDDPVPELSVTLAVALAACALGLFVVFLHHAVRSLNASAVIRRIAGEGHESIADPYPAGVGHEPRDLAAAERDAEEWLELPGHVDVCAAQAGYIAAVDGQAIVRWASANDAFVEQRRPVGGFAVTGAIVAVVYVDGEQALDTAPIQRAFLVQEERLVDGDIAFPVRQLADVALKGLSPGINDPTTAENAMDFVTDTLVRFAQRPPICALRTDDDDVVRLRALAPTLDELVLAGFDQVRRDGASRPSFSVRLLELLADLRESAPPARGCEEIDRQAELIAEHAAQAAEHQADHQLVLDAHARLHASNGRAHAA
jgi:uncharacterized membrane protein